MTAPHNASSASSNNVLSLATIPQDLTAGLVVFFVALPLSLGIALASNAPLFSGVLAGIVGGIVVGILSRSHTSVSGPAAGLTAIVAAQIGRLGTFDAFLLAVVIGGLIQIVMGLVRAGSLSAFFPSSVIKGLLAAIGLILILKQIPHLLGHDTDPEGEMSFSQPDHENTLSEFGSMLGDIHPGAATIGLASVALLVFWKKLPLLRSLRVPPQLLVVLFGVGMSELFRQMGGRWKIGVSHLVQVPVSRTFSEFFGLLRLPDFSQWMNPDVFLAAFTIAIVASLETLLNLKGVDKLDPKQRTSPASRELLAQGVGNVVAGLIGGIPVTSVIVRSSVNINSGGQTKLSTIFHGVLLLASVMLLPSWLNMIPLSSLAAILLVTGMKLAGPAVVRQMWSEGRYQFIPFAITVVAIVLTDLLFGVVLGLAVSVLFILNSNLRRPLRCEVEKHLGGEVLHVVLANQVSFLNRAALEQVLDSIAKGKNVLLDATNTVYMDPDILSMIREFQDKTAPIRGVHVSLIGFREKYHLQNHIDYVDYPTRELQGQLTSADVLQILKDGNERFRHGRRLTRDFGRQLLGSAGGQHPLGVILSCIDSRSPAELIFDLGLGDIFSVRIAGNVISEKVLGSMEYGCAVAGAKVIVVLGHTNCGAVTAAVNLAGTIASVQSTTGCQHLQPIVDEIQDAIDPPMREQLGHLSPDEKAACVNSVAERNVSHSVQRILSESDTIRRLVLERRIAVVGAMYDVVTGHIEFFPEEVPSPQSSVASRRE